MFISKNCECSISISYRERLYHQKSLRRVNVFVVKDNILTEHIKVYACLLIRFNAHFADNGSMKQPKANPSTVHVNLRALNQTFKIKIFFNEKPRKIDVSIGDFYNLKYLCYGSTTIINNSILSLRGPSLYTRIRYLQTSIKTVPALKGLKLCRNSNHIYGFKKRSKIFIGWILHKLRSDIDLQDLPVKHSKLMD